LLKIFGAAVALEIKTRERYSRVMSRLKRLISPTDTEALRLAKYTESFIERLDPDVRRQVVAAAGDNAAAAEDKWRRAVTEALADVEQAAAAGGAQYIHHQGVPSVLWSITHNLGGYPAVAVVDSANRVGFGEVTYIDTNTLTVEFSAGFSGKALLVL
jgi:hypothetical protein